MKTYLADGLTYKLGVHDKMYRQDGDKRIRSSKTLEEVIIRAERHARTNINTSDSTLALIKAKAKAKQKK